MSQTFRLIAPPSTPEKPSSPNRLALLLVGLVLSVGFGVGSGSLAEFMDRAVYDSRQLGRLTQQSVMASVPYIETRRDRLRSTLKKLSIILGLLLCTASVFTAVHLWIIPLDQLWLQVQETWRTMV